MFENSLIRNIHKSRYVASWINMGGTFGHHTQNIKDGPFVKTGCYAFREWRGTLVIDGEHLTEDEIQEIYLYAKNGKLELEDSAAAFMKG